MKNAFAKRLVDWFATHPHLPDGIDHGNHACHPAVAPTPLPAPAPPLVTAQFSPASGGLSVFGDSQDNTLTINRDAAGTIRINDGAVPVLGGQPTVANTRLIQVFGQAGNDTITLSEVNGALPAANLFGGAGNDVMTGGSGGDRLFGQAGNDQLLGKGGDDQLFGGDGDDTLTGGDGNDQLFGEAGNDRIIWNPGDDSDTAEGGAGIDTLEVNAGNGSEEFFIATDAGRVIVGRSNPAPFTISAGTMERIVLNANGGDDTVDASALHDAAIALTIDGGTGNDTLRGSSGADLLFGGDGNDTVSGGGGTDTAFLGNGDDTFIWNPGEGSDIVDGQDGTDTMRFNGANVAEDVNISANGDHALFARNIGGVTMDLHGVEHVTFNALGGADHVTVNDLGGTDVTEVTVDLARAGGIEGDGAADKVTVNATAGDDVIIVSTLGDSTAVDGLHTRVTVDHAEADRDQLIIHGLGGNDVIDATLTAAGKIGLVLDGGSGDDILIGGEGDDTLLGGDGDDVLIGGNGHNTLNGGLGADIFIGLGDVIIDGFDAANDRIDLSNVAGALNFNAILSHAQNVGSDVVIDFGPHATITLHNTQMASLGSDDFIWQGNAA